jgi:hypothetical protein
MKKTVSFLVRYGATFYAGWLAAFFSAIIANKGISKIRVVVDKEAGIIDD